MNLEELEQGELVGKDRRERGWFTSFELEEEACLPPKDQEDMMNA